MSPLSASWQPKRIVESIKALPTGTSAVLVQTELGQGYLKAMGNAAGPHALACEWIGTRLAERLGLPTFDFALIEIQSDDVIPFARGGRAEPGPAFISRRERGGVWGGTKRQLKKVENAGDFTRLVLFDTWIRNRDRHPRDPSLRKPNRDNVFLSRESMRPGLFRLLAMDHSHCLTTTAELNPRLADISEVREEGCYGLFPEFLSFLDREELRDAVQMLSAILQEELRVIVESVPPEWEVSAEAREAVVEFLYRRASFVSGNIEGWIWGQREFDFSPESEDIP